MGYKRQSAVVLTVAGSLVACSLQPDDVATARSGPPLVITPEDATAYAQRQQAVLAQISVSAGLASEPTSPAEWRRFGIAAFGLADEQCDAYMAAIRRVNIARRQTVQEINLAGTATAAILGIARATSEAVAVTATAFGLAQATADNVASGLLYELPPSAVSDLVHRLRAAYSSAISQSGAAAWADRPTTFRTIRGYIELCLPAVIEARIADSVTAAKPTVQNISETPTGAPPLIGIEGAGPSITPLGPQGAAPAAPNVGPQSAERVIGAQGDESFLTAAEGREIQRALCLTPDAGRVTFGSETRKAIEFFRATAEGRRQYAEGLRLSKALGKGEPASNVLTAREISFLRGRKCDNKCYRNAYEFYQYGSLDQLQSLLNRIIKAVPTVQRPIIVSGSRVCDPEIRSLISRLSPDGTLTPALVETLPPEL